MKYLLLFLLLTGCEMYPPSVVEANPQIPLPDELKDCKRYEIHSTTYSSSPPELIYRCPNSTTSTVVTIPQGKATIQKTTVVIDGVIYTKK
jgi:hypothetical protein